MNLKDIARSTTTLEERIRVMKEVLKSIANLNKQVNQLRSYNNYKYFPLFLFFRN